MFPECDEIGRIEKNSTACWLAMTGSEARVNISSACLQET
jgi:hypothetical protein